MLVAGETSRWTFSGVQTLVNNTEGSLEEEAGCSYLQLHLIRWSTLRWKETIKSFSRGSRFVDQMQTLLLDCSMLYFLTLQKGKSTETLVFRVSPLAAVCHCPVCSATWNHQFAVTSHRSEANKVWWLPAEEAPMFCWCNTVRFLFFFQGKGLLFLAV